MSSEAGFLRMANESGRLHLHVERVLLIYSITLGNMPTISPAPQVYLRGLYTGMNQDMAPLHLKGYRKPYIECTFN